MATERDEERARDQARAQVESICEMVAALQCNYERLEELREMRDDIDADNAQDALIAFDESDEGREYAELKSAAGDCESEDDARERINEDPLSVEVRSDWHTPGADDDGPSEYMILLCTGGPAVRIVGDLGRFNEPSSARVEYQDWFTPWVELVDLSSDERDALLTYAQQFYYGD